MGWRRPSLTAGRRPALEDREAYVVAQSRVALYDGDTKTPALEGWAYLTTRRLCVVNNGHTGAAAAIDLQKVIKCEYSPRFLQNSAKITVIVDNGPRNHTPPSLGIVTWVCRICSFSNEMSRSYAHGTSQLPICETCGVQSTHEQVDAALLATPATATAPGDPVSGSKGDLSAESQICSRCTFINHPEMDRCEMCGAPLKQLPAETEPELFHKAVRLSFRSGGSHLFFEKLETGIRNATDETDVSRTTSRASTPDVQSRHVAAGLHTLLKQRTQVTECNLDPAIQVLLDLLPLRRMPAQSSTKLLSSVKICRSSTDMELEQYARQLLEYVVDGGNLDRAGGTLALHDLYSGYNRARGIDLISAETMMNALELWTSPNLNFPEVEVRSLGNSGLKVVLRKRRMGMRKQITDWIVGLEPWKAAIGVSAREASDRFGWSLAVATEELLGAEKAGQLCRDDHPSGLRFFCNLISEQI